MTETKDLFCLDIDGEESIYVYAGSIPEAIHAYKQWVRGAMIMDGETPAPLEEISDPIAAYLVAYAEQIVKG